MAPVGNGKTYSSHDISVPSKARVEVTLNLDPNPKYKKLCKYGFAVKHTDMDGNQIPGL